MAARSVTGGASLLTCILLGAVVALNSAQPDAMNIDDMVNNAPPPLPEQDEYDMIERGTPQDLQTDDDKAFFRAVMHGDVRKTKKLLAGGDDVNKRNHDGGLAVIPSIMNHDDLMTKLLLKSGASLELTWQLGFTPMQVAAFNSQSMVELVLEAGGDINEVGIDGFTALTRALMSRANPGNDESDSVDFLLMMIKAGANVNVSNPKDMGSTPLHLGAHSGSLEMTKTLLAHGADVSATADDGSTPLHLAASLTNENALKIVEALVKNGADPTVMDGNGKSPLDLAPANSEIHRVLKKAAGKEEL